ncbi:zf-HC2 domain-containing protein [Streptomyces sp. HNM0575]|uniref:anti-sigma factor family protein n=1 Tax=Streptomyces sp. HNM0575 TaxID=2716338 RepID=UPI001F0E963C|nr:zf-HC2 domain-containing protein [Streptomyces sp. HNM0575]
MGGRAPHPERELTPAEQHLGDRLAALIDGELGHDARERVLSHLATCRGCKAEADAQRRVKSVFADMAPPPPSDGLLARLQGLPGTGPEDDPYDGMPPGSAGAGVTADGSRSAGGGLPGTSAPAAHAESSGSVWPLDQLWGGRGGSLLSPGRGFRIHEFERLSARGRRFAFAAAGAVSLAALALAGGVGTSGTAGGPSIAKGDTGTASASSVRTAGSGGSADRERRRRDGYASNEAVSGTVLSASTASADSTGESLKSGRGTGLHRGAPWAAPTAPPAGAERDGSGAPLPLLREAFFSSYAHGSQGHGSYGLAAAGDRDSAPSPVTTAASQQH